MGPDGGGLQPGSESAECSSAPLPVLNLRRKVLDDTVPAGCPAIITWRAYSTTLGTTPPWTACPMTPTHCGPSLRGTHAGAQVPMAWREHLASQGVRTGRSVLHHQVRSTCGTRKFLLQLADGRVVETVGIPIDEDGGGVSRLTVCVSSQVRGAWGSTWSVEAGGRVDGWAVKRGRPVAESACLWAAGMVCSVQCGH